MILLELLKLFTLLTTIEREYGIASLEKGEREVLDIIVAAAGKNEEISAETIVALNIASRATTYRRIRSLKHMGLIETHELEGRSLLRLGLKFESFAKSLNILTGSKI